MTPMARVKELPREAHTVRRVWWTCDNGHQGVGYFGVDPVCAECCHGGEIRHPLTCTHCGARWLDPKRTW